MSSIFSRIRVKANVNSSMDDDSEASADPNTEPQVICQDTLTKRVLCQIWGQMRCCIYQVGLCSHTKLTCIQSHSYYWQMVCRPSIDVYITKEAHDQTLCIRCDFPQPEYMEDEKPPEQYGKVL